MKEGVILLLLLFLFGIHGIFYLDIDWIYFVTGIFSSVHDNANTYYERSKNKTKRSTDAASWGPDAFKTLKTCIMMNYMKSIA